MDLPRIASETSISPTNIELLNYNHTPDGIINDQNRAPRTPVPNRRFLSTYVCDNNVNVQPHPPQFSSLSAAGASLQPSRKREEACALENLKKRVQALRLSKANQQDHAETNNAVRDNQELDNRPQLFQKVNKYHSFIFLGYVNTRSLLRFHSMRKHLFIPVIQRKT